MKTFTDLDTLARYRVAHRLWKLGLHATPATNPRARRISRATSLLTFWVAGWEWFDGFPKCAHFAEKCDDTGHCSNCGKVWPTYGPEELPFP